LYHGTSTSDADFTNVANWEKVGVGGIELKDFDEARLSPKYVNNSYVGTNGSFISYNGWARTELINISPFSSLIITTTVASNYNVFYKKDKSFASAFSLSVGDNTVEIPEDAYYIVLSNTTASMLSTIITIDEYRFSTKSGLQTERNSYLVDDNNGLDSIMGMFEESLETPSITETAQYLSGKGIITNIANNFTLLAVDVTPGELYKITAKTSPGNSLYAYYNNEVKTAWFNLGITSITDKYIIIPYGVNKLYVQRMGTTGQVQKVTLVSPKSSDNNDIFTDIPNSEIPPSSFEDSKGINGSGSIVAMNSQYLLSSPVPVIPGNVYFVTGVQHWGNYVYAFFDENDNFITGSGHKAASGATKTFVYCEKAVAPENASYLRVSSITSPSFGVMNSQQEIKRINLEGKKWAIIGDSLSESWSVTLAHYYDFILPLLNTPTINNVSVSGTGYAKGTTNFRVQAQSIDTDADIVTLFGSFNDLALDIPLGNITDNIDQTYCGCMNIALDNVFSRVPKAKVGVITPTPWAARQPGNENAESYVDALVAICERRSIPCLDLYHCSGLRPWTNEYKLIAYKRDGTYTASNEEVTGAVQVTSELLQAVRSCGLPSVAIGDWVLPSLAGTHPDEFGHSIIANRFLDFVASL
jgi:hypothetical protein